MPVLLRNVTVIGPREGSRDACRDVLLDGERLARVTRSGDVAAPEDATVVDGTGKYLVPGFNDMHAHALNVADPSGTFTLMLAHGVTGFRQMSGSDEILERRSAGTLMPRLSPRLLATPGALLTPINASTARDAVAEVRHQKERGADFIKAAAVSRDVFGSVQAEARRLGIPVTGHLPAGIDVERASGDGMRSIEHLGPGTGIIGCCSSERDAVLDEVAARPQIKVPSFARLKIMQPLLDLVVARLVVNPANALKQPDIEIIAHALATFDEKQVAAIAARFVADGTWQVPTLIRSRTNYLCDDPTYARDPNLRYVSPKVEARWHKAAKSFTRFSEAEKVTLRATYAVMLQLTKLFDEAGVPMLAGSDHSGAAWEVPGIALHQEFDLLATAGLSPLRVLQMTTCEPARFLNRDAEMGSVEAGKLADLVLLEGDPLESVANLHRIAGVARAGHWLSAADLGAMRDQVAHERSAG